MDDELFEDHVKMLKWKFAKPVCKIEMYTARKIYESTREIDMDKLLQIENAVIMFIGDVYKHWNLLCWLFNI